MSDYYGYFSRISLWQFSLFHMENSTMSRRLEAAKTATKIMEMLDVFEEQERELILGFVLAAHDEIDVKEPDYLTIDPGDEA